VLIIDLNQDKKVGRKAKTRQYYRAANNIIKCRQQAKECRRVEQFVVNAKQSIFYSSTGRFSVAGVGLVQYMVHFAIG